MSLTRRYWIWVSAIVCLFSCAFLAAIFAAQGPAMLDAPQLATFEALPVYAPSGTLTSFHCTAKFRVLELQPDGRTQELRVKSVEFDLVRQGSQVVNLNGQLAEYQDIADDLIGIAMFNWRLAHPGQLPTNPPEPVRRRATRADQ